MPRAFISLPALPPLLPALLAMLDAGKALDVAKDVRWERAGQLHLTLSFLGEQPLPRLRQLVHTLQATYADQPPVRLRLTGAGCFPPKGAPRVIYAGVDGGDTLLGLAARTKQAAKACGITLDAKQSGSFTAHFTLGRVREVADPARALALAASLKEMPAELVEQTASEALIMLSELRPTGAVHSTYARLPFGWGISASSPE